MRKTIAFLFLSLGIFLPSALADKVSRPEIAEFESTESMCLDALIVNMVSNQCIIHTSRDSDGSLRYDCHLPETVVASSPSVWNQSTFFVYGNTEVGVDFQVPESRRLACQDHTLRIYYF